MESLSTAGSVLYNVQMSERPKNSAAYHVQLFSETQSATLFVIVWTGIQKVRKCTHQNKKKPYLIKIITIYPFKIIFSGSSGGLPSQLLLFLHFSVEFASCPLWFVSVQWLLDHVQCVTWIQICCVGWAVGRDFGIEVWVQGGGERGWSRCVKGPAAITSDDPSCEIWVSLSEESVLAACTSLRFVWTAELTMHAVVGLHSRGAWADELDSEMKKMLTFRFMCYAQGFVKDMANLPLLTPDRWVWHWWLHHHHQVWKSLSYSTRWLEVRLHSSAFPVHFSHSILFDFIKSYK